MKIIFHFLLLLLPGIGLAQTCFQPFSTNCWFSSANLVRISSDGTRFFVVSGTGPAANSNSASCATVNTPIKVYNVTNAGIALNSAASTDALSFEVSDFTANNGYFYTNNTSGSDYSINFKEAGGTPHQLGVFTEPHNFEKVAGAPNKMIIRLVTDNKAVILDASTPSSPTATTITLPGGNMGPVWGSLRPVAVANQTADRIYYVATEDESGNTTAPYRRVKIKACTMAGVAATGWTDVVIQKGQPYEMAIRPTDSRIFIRTAQTDTHLDFHGLVIINADGTLPTDMNMADLSVMGAPLGSSSESYRDLAFDSQGNIYANRWAHISGPSTNVLSTGLVKFDAQGNLDLGFQRNIWNSFAESAGGGANAFDLSDTGVLIKCSKGVSGANEGVYATDINHVNGNNEKFDLNYTSSPSATVPPVPLASSSNYKFVQFLFNNGKLIRPSMTAGDIASNCGIATPLTIPVTIAAAGMINCSKTAFISAPVAGTPSSIAIRVEINVTAPGTFSPITLSGSGFSLLDPNYTIKAATNGIQTFVIPAHYDGSALTTLDIGAGQAGTCTADLSDLATKTKKVEIEIWTPENCTFKQVGPVLK